MTVNLYTVAQEKKIRGYEPLTHTFTKWIRHNQNKQIETPNQRETLNITY